MGQTKKKKRAKQQYNPADEIPENLKNFIDSVSIKPDENAIVQKKPKKQKEIKEDPVSKLTNRKVCIIGLQNHIPFSIIFSINWQTLRSSSSVVILKSDFLRENSQSLK